MINHLLLRRSRLGTNQLLIMLTQQKASIVFFSTIGNAIADQIAPTNKTADDYLTGDFPNELILNPTDSLEIINITKKLKTKYSSDNSGLSSAFIKKIIVYIALPLSHIFNLSTSQGIFPQQDKIAKVVPVFKAGERDSTNNYRPISLLPIFSKILEKLIADRLLEFLKHFSIFLNNNMDFKKVS